MQTAYKTMWEYVCEWGRKQGMTEKEKLEDHKGSGTHWQQKNPKSILNLL